MANRNKNSNCMIQYLVGCTKGDFVIEIPATWKVTFAQVNPDPSGNRGYNDNAHCVRVWEGEKLRAVFANCIGLRDMSIPLARKVVKTESESEYKSDSLGNFTSASSRKMLDMGFVVEAEDDPFDEDDDDDGEEAD